MTFFWISSIRAGLFPVDYLVALPPDFAAVLECAPPASQFFQSLSYSKQRRIILSIQGARTEEARQRRIAKSIEQFHAGKA